MKRANNYKAQMIEIQDMIWEEICEADSIERDVVGRIARAYGVVLTEEEYQELKAEWEEV